MLIDGNGNASDGVERPWKRGLDAYGLVRMSASYVPRRCHPTRVDLRKLLQVASRQGCSLVFLDGDAMAVCLAGGGLKPKGTEAEARRWTRGSAPPHPVPCHLALLPSVAGMSPTPGDKDCAKPLATLTVHEETVTVPRIRFCRVELRSCLSWP